MIHSLIHLTNRIRRKDFSIRKTGAEKDSEDKRKERSKEKRNIE